MVVMVGVLRWGAVGQETGLWGPHDSPPPVSSLTHPGHHEWLLGPEVDILPFLLLPLAGPEDFSEEEMEREWLGWSLSAGQGEEVTKSGPLPKSSPGSC